MSEPGIPDVLARIVAVEQDVVSNAKRARSISDLRSEPLYDHERRSFVDVLTSRSPAIIAECKHRSPSKGVLRADYDAVAVAKGYEKGGAAAISVLTNEEFFGGTLADLSAVRQAVDLPILRKDFVVDPYQLEEARAAGADTVLLIAAILEEGEMKDLVVMATSLGLEVLVEIHQESELEGALASGAQLIGINNRNLHDFSTDIATTERLAPSVPADRTIIAESGLRSGTDLLRLSGVGVSSFLVGEAFMTAAVPGEALAAMIAEASPAIEDG